MRLTRGPAGKIDSGKADGYRCAASDCALNLDAALPGINDRLADCQTESGVSLFPVAGTVCTVETVEDMWKVRFRDADPGVFHVQNRELTFLLRA